MALDFLDNKNVPDPGEELNKGLAKALLSTGKGAKYLYGLTPEKFQEFTTPKLKGAYNAVEPLTSKIFNTIGEWPLRTGTNIAKNIVAGDNPLKNVGEVSSTPNSSDYHNVLEEIKNSKSPWVNAFRKSTPLAIADMLPDRLRDIWYNDVGMAANLVGDPLMHGHIGGVTKAGEKALKAGTEASTLAEGAQKGERSLLTLGNTPIVPKKVSEVALGGLTSINKAADKVPLLGQLKEGMKTQTKNVGFNNDKLQKLVNPTNAATIDAIAKEAADKSVIERNAARFGMTPEQMSQRMLDYMEPLGSQRPPKAAEAMKSWNRQMKAIQQTVGDTLPPEIKELADSHVAENLRHNLSEGGKTRGYYVEHNSTPEWVDFRNKLYPKIGEADQSSINSALNDAIKGRGPLGKYTINEINNLSQGGQLHKVPGLGNIPQLSEFKSKLFDDNASRISAQRYLENAKVLNMNDFMKHTEKTYGVDQATMLKKYADKEIVPGDLVEFTHEGKKVYYPPEIAEALGKMKDMGKGSQWERGMQRSIQELNDFTKTSYFGLFPASVGKIFLGNQALSYINGLWNPIAQINGLMMAKNLRLGNLSDRVIVNSPKLGALTEKQVFDLAKEHRGYGMGLFRAEVPSLQEKKYLGSEKAQKYVDAMWRGHNFVEDSTRLGTFIEALRQGYDPFAAGKATRKALYDYSDRGPLDRKLSNLVPFYTFARKNIENMAKNWIKNPGRAGLPLKFQNEFNDQNTDPQENWSASKAEGTPIKVGDQMLHLNSMWPSNDVNRWTGSGKTFGEILKDSPKSAIKTATSMVNPLLRIPGEIGANFNLNQGQPIERIQGQKAAIGPFVANKRFVQYPLSQIRAVQDPLQSISDPNTTPFQKAMRYGFGLTFHTPDPAQEKDMADLKEMLNFKGSHIAGMKNMPKLFAKEAQRKFNKGDLTGAKAAYENQKLSYQQLIEEAKKMREER